MKFFAAGLSTLVGLSLLGACGAADDQTGEDEASSRKRCGNRRIDPGEQCDKQNLNGETCASATMGSRPGGTLRCTNRCRFDTRRCSGGTGGTAGTGGAAGSGGLGGNGGVSG